MAEVLSPFALCTEADAAAYLPDGAIDVDLLTRLVNAASEALTNLADREFVSGDATRAAGGALDPIPATERVFAGSELLYIPRDHPWWAPLRDRELELGDAQAIESVVVEAEDGTQTTIDAADFVELPLRRRRPWLPLEAIGFRSSVVIRPSDVVRVTAKWGFPSVPEVLRQEAIRTACSWYTRDVARSSSTFAADEQTTEPAAELAHVLPRSSFETALAFRRNHFG